jgi:hypothetical protein
MADDNLLEMSDEDFAKMSPSEFEETGSDVVDESQDEPEQDEVIDETDVEDEEAEETEAEPEQDMFHDSEEEQESDEDVSEDELSEDGEAKNIADLEAFQQLILEPFKASGKQIQVKDAKEAVRLMQMGADYSNKTQAMKGHRKTLKQLENNGIGPEELNYLIDLKNKDPEAISKLVKEAGIDPMDLNIEDNKYTPGDHSVDDKTVELDEVIDSIRSTSSFNTTMGISTKWDKASKSALVEKPAILEALNEQVANGTYKVVMQELEREQMFGGYANLSDLDAYFAAGEAIYKRGGFDTQETEPKQTKRVATKPKGLSAEEAKRKDKKLKASPNRTNKKTAVKQMSANDLLSMSDDEFAKLKL